MATNGLLNFNGTNKATFVGANSNIVLDTVNSSLGIGITGTDAPSSNLYITGNAYVSSDLTVSTNTLHVDTTNSRVGVGTVSPVSTLDVVGDVDISSNLAVSGSKFTYDNSNTTVFTGTATAAANEIGYLDMSTSSASNNIHVKVYIKHGQGGGLGNTEYSFYIRPSGANTSLIYDYKNQLGPITPVVYRTNANDLHSGGTPGVVRFGYSIASAQNVIWRVEVSQRSNNVTFYPTNTGSAMVTTGLVQVTPTPFTRFDSNVMVSGNVGIGTATPDTKFHVVGGPTKSDGFILSTANNVYTPGCIYTDSNWGMLFRGAVSSPGIADFVFNDYAGNNMMVINDSKVGIGKTSPSVALDVNGVIKSTVPSWHMYNTDTIHTGTLNFTENMVTPQNCSVSLSTGRVTITVAGRYCVSFHAFTESSVTAGTGCQIAIMKSGTTYVRNYHIQPVTGVAAGPTVSSSLSATGGLTAIMDLAVNDYVEVNTNFLVHFNLGATFSGFLIG